MEGDRKLNLILAAIAVVVVIFSYGVGYYIGKQAGKKEEKQICEVEKKRLLKALLKVNPVSRPQPQVENKVVGEEKEKVTKEEKPEAKESEKNSESLTNATAETAEENATSGENVTEKSAESSNTTQEEEATPSTNEVVPKKVYYLQVGVFRNRSNAVRFASELKAKGFDAKTEFFDDRTRVVVGYFDSQEEALSVKRELKRKGFDSILKWREE